VKFTDLQFTNWHELDDRFKVTGFMRAHVKFKNNYGASVIFGPMIHGFELAVLKNDELCYDSGITEDVIVGLEPDDITELLEKIEELK